MALSVPELLTVQLQEFEDEVQKVENALLPLLELNFMDPSSKLTSLERAQCSIGAAQAISALLHMYLRTQGLDPEDSIAAKEKDRLKQYVSKVKKASAAFELGETPRTASINIAAANRFINAAITDLTSEQRQGLKQVGQTFEQKRSKRPAAAMQDLWADEGGAPEPPAPSTKAPKLRDAVASFLTQVLDPGAQND